MYARARASVCVVCACVRACVYVSVYIALNLMRLSDRHVVTPSLRLTRESQASSVRTTTPRPSKTAQLNAIYPSYLRHGNGLLLVAGHGTEEVGVVHWVVQVGGGRGVRDGGDALGSAEAGHGQSAVAGQTAYHAHHLVLGHAHVK